MTTPTCTRPASWPPVGSAGRFFKLMPTRTSRGVAATSHVGAEVIVDRPLQRRYPDEVEAQMVPELVKAIYPEIPVEQHDVQIQARNHPRVTVLATKLWRKFRQRKRERLTMKTPMRLFNYSLVIGLFVCVDLLAVTRLANAVDGHMVGCSQRVGNVDCNFVVSLDRQDVDTFTRAAIAPHLAALPPPANVVIAAYLEQRILQVRKSAGPKGARVQITLRNGKDLHLFNVLPLR
jgi:hypothetical protein